MGLIQNLTPGATYQQELSSDLRHPSRVAGQKKKKSWSLSHMVEFPTMERDCERNISYHISKHMSSHHCFGASKCEWGLPKQKTMPAIQQMPPPRPDPQPQCWGARRHVRNQKKPGCWPQIADMHRTGKTSKTPHSCIFPLTVNSLIWDYPFSLINNKLWCANCLEPCYKLKYILIPSPAFSGSFSGLHDTLSPWLEVLNTVIK